MTSQKELSQDTIKEFVTVAHFNLARVQELLAEYPALLNVTYEWSPGDHESGMMAGAHVGNRPIVEFFLTQGVPLNICVAAMLGQTDDVKRFLDADSSLANARGAHNIPIMFHAAMSGNLELVKLLKARGCTEGYSDSLHGAISYGHTPIVAWLLDNGAQNLDVPDYRDKTPLTSATELGHTEIADLLRARGAT